LLDCLYIFFIYVKNTFIDRLNNKDPQLERAVQEILIDLKK